MNSVLFISYSDHFRCQTARNHFCFIVGYGFATLNSNKTQIIYYRKKTPAEFPAEVPAAVIYTNPGSYVIFSANHVSTSRHRARAVGMKKPMCPILSMP
ncbi:MAG: hypothetical protein R3307_08105, partial [Anaerolineales bacterium]|nr:hypothetical protein [Anaerolineales bacterium]